MNERKKRRASVSNQNAALPEKGGDPRLFLQTVARTMRVLEAFGHRQVPHSLAELAAAAGIDKSAAQRICYTLQALGYLERDALTGRLRPGLSLLDRTFDFQRMHPLVERAFPILAELRTATGQRVDLSLFDDLSIIYALRLQGRSEPFVATLIGRRLPTYCSTGGRAIMSLLQDEEVASILHRSELKPLTRYTLTDPVAIMEKVQEARRDAYAFTEQEWVMGEMAIGVAIIDANARPVAAIHVAGSLAHWDAQSFREKIAPLAIEAARAIRA
ncbi:IclR family transcriptional regulator [Pseudoroseomonas wenyumeiae]|uniref:IclR family transcriptional regulator n=2 Tax=Teichococcus wenyumeiae TaxID=2478470 RepID=A0A3A9JFN5_9PROT|nr:IclR family transcriptional regulator [Pseudoroseomonas wenyumeiae]RKK03503.1 IclR family transcriptional regulator [Pseudoroseomonas wenyumeiae]RMI16998.1 IclR family transcriptional regulator [Pseudoroseomonas wenyumeiae]